MSSYMLAAHNTFELLVFSNFAQTSVPQTITLRFDGSENFTYEIKEHTV